MRFLDTTGQPTLGIGLCDRCRRKFPLAELIPDRNTPGLRVCADDADDYDPYRLPMRAADRINLPFVRPDEDFSFEEDPVIEGYIGWVGVRGIGSIGLGFFSG